MGEETRIILLGIMLLVVVGLVMLAAHFLFDTSNQCSYEFEKDSSGESHTKIKCNNVNISEISDGKLRNIS